MEFPWKTHVFFFFFLTIKDPLVFEDSYGNWSCIVIVQQKTVLFHGDVSLPAGMTGDSCHFFRENHPWRHDVEIKHDQVVI